MALIGAAITAGATFLGSLIGGMFSSSSQRSANETNLEVARETNKQNKDLFNQQLAWTEDMWNKNNQYNSPAETVKRLQAAGINPALGSVFGQASMPGTPSAPQMQGATVNPVDYSWIGNSISTGVNAFYNNNLTNEVTKKTMNDAQISKVKAELDTKALRDSLMRIANDAKKSEYEREHARIQMSILDRTQEDSVRQAAWQTKIQEQEYEDAVNRIAESKLRQRSQEILNQYLPDVQESVLRQYKANVAALYSSARKNDAEAVESGARKILTDLQSEGVRLSNQEKDSLMDALIDESWNKADEAYWNAQQSAKVFRMGRLSEVPANDISNGGRSYTNFNTHSRNRTKGRIYRDRHGNRIYNYPD